MAEEGSFYIMTKKKEGSFYLPEDIEENILVRLPVKSIFRFESVCKRWQSLLRSKRFSEFYFDSGHHHVSIPTKADLRSLYPDLTAPRRRHGGTSLKSAIGPLSNGIYALTSVWTLKYVYLHTLKIALFNPATRRLKFAPPFPDEYLRVLTGISSHRCSVSCGVDSDYRVVVLINYDIYLRSARVEITGRRRLCFLAFLYNGDHWERIVDLNSRRKRTGVFEKTYSVLDDMMACSQKLLNGCWHWLTREFDEEGIEDNYTRFGVISYDFAAKSFGLIQGPYCMTNTSADLFVLQDHLATIVIDGLDLQCEIWMKTSDIETTWMKVYSVNVSKEFNSGHSILHEVDYYRVEEPELIKIRRLMLINNGAERLTFDEDGHLVEEYIEPSNEIRYSVAGISKFKPTLERLPLPW